jgi:lipopolysaccharide/colanic/teichoic acid biosynthesis glycosyltransferase
LEIIERAKTKINEYEKRFQIDLSYIIKLSIVIQMLLIGAGMIMRRGDCE